MAAGECPCWRRNSTRSLNLGFRFDMLAPFKPYPTSPAHHAVCAISNHAYNSFMAKGAPRYLISSSLFVLAFACQTLADTLYPIPLEILSTYRPPGFALALGFVAFVASIVGLVHYAVSTYRSLRSTIGSRHETL